MTVPTRRLKARRLIVDRRVADVQPVAPPPPPPPPPPPVITPPPSNNMPAGLPIITDEKWSAPIPTNQFGTIQDGQGWAEAYNTAGNVSEALGTLIAMFPKGFGAGGAAATIYRPLNALASKLYVGMPWHCNAGWQGAPDSINKILNFGIGSSWLWLVMYGPAGGPYSFRLGPEFLGSWTYAQWDTGHAAVPGEAYFLELLIDLMAHTVSVFVDGAPVKEFNLTLPSSPNQFQIYPGAGGSGAWKTQAGDVFVYGETVIAGQ